MIVNYHQSGKEVTGLIRTCYACGSDKTVQYQYTKAPGIGISELWYRSARDDMSYSEAAVIAFEEYVKRKK